MLRSAPLIIANVDWSKIAHSLESYTKKGYKQIETPWIVPRCITEITCIDETAVVSADDGQEGERTLVGSAEQGFLELRFHNELPDGWYVSAGPCFRIGTPPSWRHQYQFFKVELICFFKEEDTKDRVLDTLICNAIDFMETYKAKLDIRETPEGLDLEINGIEVGSYGTRYHEKIGWWGYGTGIAEPRFTQALTRSR
jgi:seryl-tRNA synthetase